MEPGNQSYTVDDQNRNAVISFVAYITENTPLMQDMGIDPSKGIFIFGNPGSGKSILFRAWQECLTTKHAWLFRRSNFTTAREVSDEYLEKGQKGLRRWANDACRVSDGRMTCVDCLFDDLGNESAASYFGNRKEPMDDVITYRYDLQLKHGLKTHFTSNLGRDGILEKYGDRVKSRIPQMCNIIEIGGNSNAIDRRK